MKTRVALSLALCAGLLLQDYNLGAASNGYMSRVASQHNSSKSSFRYVIINNEVTNDLDLSDDGYRYVEVLLDDKAFSEENLGKLFELVSKRFPTPKVLHVQVYTSLEDVETPEEREEGKISEVSADPSADNYHRAFYLRDADGNEWFSYNPYPPSREIRTVRLKGGRWERQR